MQWYLQIPCGLIFAEEKVLAREPQTMAGKNLTEIMICQVPNINLPNGIKKCLNQGIKRKYGRIRHTGTSKVVSTDVVAGTEGNPSGTVA